MAKAKVKVLSYKSHEQCQNEHVLVLVTQPDSTRNPLESCGKINFYLHLMKVKYGWKIETIGRYTRENLELLQRDLEERDARDPKAEEKAASSSPPKS